MRDACRVVLAWPLNPNALVALTFPHCLVLSRHRPCPAQFRPCTPPDLLIPSWGIENPPDAELAEYGCRRVGPSVSRQVVRQLRQSVNQSAMSPSRACRARSVVCACVQFVGLLRCLVGLYIIKLKTVQCIFCLQNVGLLLHYVCCLQVCNYKNS